MKMLRRRGQTYDFAPAPYDIPGNEIALATDTLSIVRMVDKDRVGQQAGEN